MRIRALTGLEREKLEQELRELQERIAVLQAILADEKKLLSVIREELLLISDKYGDDRRTSIGYDESDISIEDMIPNENTIITMTNIGYIKRMTMDNFKSQNRGGKGIKGMHTLEEDFIEDMLLTKTHHYLMFFTNSGKAYRLKAYEIPEASRTARGTAIINLLQLSPEEKITAVISIKDYRPNEYLFMTTKYGIVKKTLIKEYANIRKTGLQAINLREGDELIEVKVTNNQNDIFLATKQGQCIRFNEKDVRPTGRNSMGVIGMNLKDGDEVIGMQTDIQGDYFLFVSENGLGKLTALKEFTVQRRGGKGIRCYKINDKTGNVVGMKAVFHGYEVMLITTEGIIIRMGVETISRLGRNASGVKLMNLDENVKVASVAKVQSRIVEEELQKLEGTEDQKEKKTEEEMV